MGHPIRNLLLMTLLLSSIGLLSVYNASVAEAFNDFGDKYYFAKQQLVWLLAGFAIFFVLSSLPFKLIKKLIPVAFFISLIFMIAVIIPGVGLKVQGARRWIDLGVSTVQPSEFFKLSLLLYLAYWLEKPRRFRSFIAILVGSLILIMLQPDLGTAIIVGTTSFLVYYLSGSPLKELFCVLAIAFTLGFVLIAMSPYRLARVHTFLNPTVDPLGSGYHINQVILGLGSGGYFGVGLGRSIQKHSYLPEATTDSIFAVIGEEMGFAGGVAIIAGLLILSLYCLKLALLSKNNFAKVVIGSIGGLIGIQSFVNLSAMVALIPLTGVPLPLISYGGSSLITTFSALGILTSATKES